MLGNLVIANKFEADFVAGQILSHESVFYLNTKAYTPLPTIHPGEGPEPLLPDDDPNRHCNARWIEFYRNRPDDSTVIILIRGVDGLSIDGNSWHLLHLQHPRLKIRLAFL